MDWSSLLQDDEEWRRIVGQDAATVLLRAAKSRAPIEVGFEGRPAELESDTRLRAHFELALEVTDRLRRNPNARLDVTEEQALHAFVHLVARPALPVTSGDFAEPPDTWKALDRGRDVIRGNLDAVGRIDHDGAPRGTGFLVGDSIVLTNRHVVAALAGVSTHMDPQWPKTLTKALPALGEAWSRADERCPLWDPAEAPAERSASARRVTGVRGMHSELDMALLELERPSLPAEAPVLYVSGAPPTGDVYLLGYPVVDFSYLHAALVTILFDARAPSAIKRVAPGRVRGEADGILRHDATTLRGSSGSPVLDLGTHLVVGLHFSGTYGIENEAIAFWKPSADGFLAEHGIQRV